MTIDFTPYSRVELNPFAAFMTPEVVVAAHERMAVLVSGKVHRPLDKPRLVKAGMESLAANDDDIDAELDLNDGEELLDSTSDISDIVSGTFGGLIQVAA